MIHGEREKAAKTEHTPEPTGWFFTDDPQVVAMPGSGYFPGPTPPNDAINLVPLYAHPDPRVAKLEKQRDELLAALEDTVSVAKDALDHWDKDRDMKVGKLLHALSGLVKGYDRRADAVHNAIASVKGGAA